MRPTHCRTSSGAAAAEAPRAFAAGLLPPLRCAAAATATATAAATAAAANGSLRRRSPCLLTRAVTRHVSTDDHRMERTTTTGRIIAAPTDLSPLLGRRPLASGLRLFSSTLLACD